jgi:hypothetical protein
MNFALKCCLLLTCLSAAADSYAGDSLIYSPYMQIHKKACSLGLYEYNRTPPVSFSDNYSHEFQQRRFKLASEMEFVDSLRNKAVDFFIEVYYFDPLSAEGKASKVKLDSFRRIISDNIIISVIGEWRWLWTGSEWTASGVSPYNSNCYEEILITFGKIYFNRNIGHNAYNFNTCVEYWEIGEFWRNPGHVRLRIQTSDNKNKFLDWNWWLHDSDNLQSVVKPDIDSEIFADDFSGSLINYAGSVWEKVIHN